MTAAPPTEWGPKTEEKLARLWSSYATGLGRLGIVLPAGSADRFRAEVLDPYTKDPTLVGRWGRVRAVAAWAEWRPDLLPRADQPTPEKLGKLRDSLSGLLAKLDEPRPSSRWFGSKTDSPLSEPSVRTLLKQCRDTFDQLTRPPPPGMADALADLRALGHEIESLLAAAPLTWPPGAALRAQELVELATGREESAPLAEAGQRLQEYTRRPEGDPVPLLLAAADALAVIAQAAGPVGKLPRDKAGWLDRGLTTLRSWAMSFGLGLLPKEWSFAEPPSLQSLTNSDTDLAPVYRPDDALGEIVRIKTFGVTNGDQVLRPAWVTVSAGPAPEGLGDLEAAVKDIDHPAAEAIRARLRDWRAASLIGTIEAAAVELFVEFWDRYRKELEATDPAPAAEIANRLAAVLEGAFGLVPFYPANFQDRPGGWIQATDGTRMTTGRVREVLRPGLTDRAGELRVPARVVVE